MSDRPTAPHPPLPAGEDPAPGRPLADAYSPADNLVEKTRRGRPRKERMTLSGLLQKFLQYCEVERRLAPQTLSAYRSDLRQFLACLRERERWGLLSQDTMTTFSETNVRDYQYYMAEHGWRVATIRRRLGSLSSFGGWLVKRGFMRVNPLAEIEVPRRPPACPTCWPGPTWSGRLPRSAPRATERFCCCSRTPVYGEGKSSAWT